MEFRYFSRVTPGDKHIKLFVLAVDDKNQEMYEVALEKGKFVDTSELMKVIIDGSQDLEEISKKEAMDIYSGAGVEKAFEDRFGQ